MSAEDLQSLDLSNLALLNRPEVELLTVSEERSLLLEIGDCKTLLLHSRSTRTFSRALGLAARWEFRTSFANFSSRRRRIPGDQSSRCRSPRVTTSFGPGWRWPTCDWWPTCLAGIAIEGWHLRDLLQEGFCGLLKAIDRFDCTKETRLASYAVWWIRQALQRAVAAGAYPVRLNPRHLQQLAESSPDLDGTPKARSEDSLGRGIGHDSPDPLGNSPDHLAQRRPHRRRWDLAAGSACLPAA